MSRPVPEAAPLVGVVLASGFALFGFLFSTDHLATALGSVLLLYPFVLFGVARSDSPDDVFVPDAVLAVGFLGAATAGLYAVATGRPRFGALVAVVVAVPPALYHARFGESINPLGPGQSLVAGLLLAGALFVFAATESALVAAGSATIVGLAALDYHGQRGGGLARRTRTVVLGCCLGGGLVAFGLLTALGRPATALAAAVVLVALGAFVALGDELQ